MAEILAVLKVQLPYLKRRDVGPEDEAESD